MLYFFYLPKNNNDIKINKKSFLYNSYIQNNYPSNFSNKMFLELFPVAGVLYPRGYIL